MESEQQALLGALDVIPEPVPEKPVAELTAEDYAKALQVLESAEERPELLSGPKFKPIRMAILKLAEKFTEKQFSSVPRRQYQEMKEGKLERRARADRLKAADRKHINSVELRTQRLEALNRLIEPQVPYTNAKALLPPETTPLLTAPGEEGKDAPAAAPGEAATDGAADAEKKEGGEPQKKKKDVTISDGVDEEDPVWLRPIAGSIHVTGLSTPGAEEFILTPPPAPSGPVEPLSRTQRKKMNAKAQAAALHVSPEAEEKDQKDATAAAPADDKAEGKAAEEKRYLNFPRSCYVCKKRFLELHQWYDQLCPPCAALNWQKRNQVTDLTGKIALLTGSRVKIGYFCGLKLLRCGATLLATSRFPHDCASRYAREPDFDQWKHRLHVFGLDLRDLKSVVRFCDLISRRYPRLDILINNAAQTIRRPPAFYRHLMPLEMKRPEELPKSLHGIVQEDVHRDAHGLPSHMRLIRNSAERSGPTVTLPEADAPVAAVAAAVGAAALTEASVLEAAGNLSAAMSQLAVAPGDEKHDVAEFPTGYFDVNGQQIDLRSTNSWVLLLDQVEPTELLEVFAINALAPFILNSRLKPMMMRVPDVDKFVINVSAMEGKFYRHKGPQHPHTNMAKAALNMMTRTSAQDFAAHRIYMNSVDTGWINDENPFDKAQSIAQTNFQTPIDEIDAMARILDPIITGVATGKNEWGKFLKDYKETEW